MQLLRFNSWMKKSLHEQKESQRIDYSKWRGVTEKINREMSATEKKLVDGNMRELEKVLKNHDWSWSPIGSEMKKYMHDKERIKGLSGFIWKYTHSYDAQNSLYDKYYSL